MSFYTLGNSNHQGFIFIGPPKCGSTAIRFWAKSVYGDHSIVHKSGEHFGIDSAEFTNLDLPTVGIVRNPYDRMISVFKHLHKTHDYYNDDEVMPLATASGFEEFVVYTYEHDLKDKNISFKKPLVDYFKKDGKIVTLTHLIKLEEINSKKGWSLLQSFCKTNHPPVYANQSTLKIDRSIYTPKSKSLVEEMFAEDLEHFSYSF